MNLRNIFTKKNKYYQRAFADPFSIILIILLSIMASYGAAKANMAQFANLSASRVGYQSQQYAAVVADTLKLQSLEDITDNIGASISLNNNETLTLNNVDDTTQHSLSELLGDSDKWTGWNYNISIEDGPANSTNNSDDATVQKIATVRIFKDGDTISRYSEQVPLSLQGSATGLPIGTIITWPTSDWQNDMKAVGGKPDNFLACNGQVVNSSKYPKLAKIMTAVPNYQGLFLRGYGSQNFSQINGSQNGVTSTLYSSGNIGNLQGDSIRNIIGEIYALNNDLGQQFFSDASISSSGALYISRHRTTTAIENGTGTSTGYPGGIAFNASYITPTANEIRPVNTAVVYLICAK